MKKPYQAKLCGIPTGGAGPTLLLGDFARATRACASSATVTMLTHLNVPILNKVKIKVADMFCACRYRNLKHLVEVAIIQRPIPTNGQGIATHHIPGSLGVERGNQSFHVFVVVPTAEQIFEVAADGHICDAKKAVELDAVMGPELAFKISLQLLLIGGQKSSGRIVHEIQDQL